jgi:hypothetical protein
MRDPLMLNTNTWKNTHQLPLLLCSDNQFCLYELRIFKRKITVFFSQSGERENENLFCCFPIDFVSFFKFLKSINSLPEHTILIFLQTVMYFTQYCSILLLPVLEKSSAATLKGQSHEIFDPQFFSSINTPGPPDSWAKAVSNINSYS